jgi:hypothetical protein
MNDLPASLKDKVKEGDHWQLFQLSKPKQVTCRHISQPM